MGLIDVQQAFDRGKADYELANDMTMRSPYGYEVLDWAWKAGFDHAGLVAANNDKREVIEQVSVAVTHAKNFAAALRYFGTIQ